MALDRLLRYITKCNQIGIVQTVRSINARYVQNNFQKEWRVRVLEKKTDFTWQDVAAQDNLSKSFDSFFSQLQKKYMHFYADKLLLFDNNAAVIQKAELAKNNIFDLLGSGPIYMPTLLWHTDFRLSGLNSAADCTFDHETFYKDIQINSYNGTSLGKDIKVPWELSRFAHLIFLGKAHQITLDESYVATFTSHITDWIDQNPFLLGINWVCPMEVALRAINWIWAFYFFKDAPISHPIWEKFICSLWQHFIYLENNWELYDGRTSNHYLSDLVGYLYLCHFFSTFSDSNKKAQICSRRIISEMERQVFAEGTSYEGSTHYHELVTELFEHAFFLMETLNIPVSDWHKERLEKMYEFISWCSPKSNSLISIGDNDSGSVLAGGISTKLMQNYKKSYNNAIKHYPEFGLSIAQTKKWHITLRHHAYSKKQPSGHFHNDAASITLAYNGIPIFVDPGSFVYTASTAWRNYFRSVNVHNTFFIKDHEPISLDEHIFGLHLPEQKVRIMHKNNMLVTQHNLYKKFGLTAQREIEYTSSKVTITDEWFQETSIQKQPLVSVLNFTLAPELKVYNQDNVWIIYNNQKELVVLTSNNLIFELIQGWVSPAYGVKEQCSILCAYAPLITGKKIVTYITT